MVKLVDMASVSTSSAIASSVEVTDSEYYQTTSSKSPSAASLQSTNPRTGSPTANRKSITKRLGNMLTPRKSRRSGRKGNAAGSANVSVCDSNASVSITSDNATMHSVEGQQSVAAFTVDSHDTVKISNKQPRPKVPKPAAAGAYPTPDKKEKGWQKFRRLVAGGKPPVHALSTPT